MEENTIKLKEELACNAQNIQVSTETKAFIILKAKLNDMYGNICNIAENEFCLTEESRKGIFRTGRCYNGTNTDIRKVGHRR